MCGGHVGHATNVRPLPLPIALETAKGEAIVIEPEDVMCDGVVPRGRQLCAAATDSRLSIALLVDLDCECRQGRAEAVLPSSTGDSYKLVRHSNF